MSARAPPIILYSKHYIRFLFALISRRRAMSIRCDPRCIPCFDTLRCGPCRRTCNDIKDCLYCGPCSRTLACCCDYLQCGPCRRDWCDALKCGPCKRACCPNCCSPYVFYFSCSTDCVCLYCPIGECMPCCCPKGLGLSRAPTYRTDTPAYARRIPGTAPGSNANLKNSSWGAPPSCDEMER